MDCGLLRAKKRLIRTVSPDEAYVDGDIDATIYLEISLTTVMVLVMANHCLHSLAHGGGLADAQSVVYSTCGR